MSDEILEGAKFDRLPDVENEPHALDGRTWLHGAQWGIPSAPDASDEPAGWQPPPCETEDDADALINRVLSKREERQRLIDQHTKRLAAIDGEIEWLEGWALPTLEEWLERNPPKRGKSRDLPRGRIGVRASKGGIIVDDEEKALDWAIDNAADAVSIPAPRLLKSKLPEDCPHVRRAPDREVFYVKGPK